MSEKLSRLEADILLAIKNNAILNQRELSAVSGHSLGNVNKALQSLKEKGFLNDERSLTESAEQLLVSTKPENAIILAAGFGMRMVPINLSVPKAMLEIKGEIMIERQIRQLHEAGINDITVVVGFMKEEFEYLIDQYHVDLKVNRNYSTRNNLSSLALVSDKLGNTYIVPCDIWSRNNPFRENELYSWYMVSDAKDENSDVRLNRKSELVRTADDENGNCMIGISYLQKDDAVRVKEKISKLNSRNEYDDSYWEEALYFKDRMIIPARVVQGRDVIEINTYEQLRDVDADSVHLHSDAIDTISKVLNVSDQEITDITVLKKGMTNRSFLFSCRNKKYIMRIPGEGTDLLINRVNEAKVFETISGLGLCDDPVYINPETGYKITAFLEGVRVCDCQNDDDLHKCMKLLKKFHEMRLSVPHTFDIFGQIQFYEELWEGQPSAYKDYVRTKQNVFALKEYIDRSPKDWCLTHIDAVPDNFLFYMDGDEEKLQLTDWEYAGMQDPYVDIAMFCIYSLYSKAEIDHLIDIYFEGSCRKEDRIRIYCYVAACGLLWSNWCEYKRKFGVEFGEYSLRQYRYGKDFYKYAAEEMKKNDIELPEVKND